MTISINEIRAENYIYVPILNKIQAITLGDFIRIMKYKPIIEGVKLTEEWLLKFGITKIWIFEIFGDDKKGYHISSESGEWVFIKYVHQLQNLCFALTGEELTINEYAR